MARLGQPSCAGIGRGTSKMRRTSTALQASMAVLILVLGSGILVSPLARADAALATPVNYQVPVGTFSALNGKTNADASLMEFSLCNVRTLDALTLLLHYSVADTATLGPLNSASFKIKAIPITPTAGLANLATSLGNPGSLDPSQLNPFAAGFNQGLLTVTGPLVQTSQTVTYASGTSQQGDVPLAISNPASGQFLYVEKDMSFTSGTASKNLVAFSLISLAPCGGGGGGGFGINCVLTPAVAATTGATVTTFMMAPGKPAVLISVTDPCELVQDCVAGVADCPSVCTLTPAMTCPLIAQIIVTVGALLSNDVIPYVPTVQPGPGTPGNGGTSAAGQGSASGHWSINLAQDASFLSPATPPTILGQVAGLQGGASNPAQTYVGVGKVHMDFLEKGKILQNKVYDPGQLVVDPASHAAPSAATKQAMWVACAAAVIGALATPGFWGMLLVPVAGYICAQAYITQNDDGEIRCGYDPPSVTYGDQFWQGDLASLGSLLSVHGSSSLNKQQTVYYGENGPVSGGATIWVVPTMTKNYDAGYKACDTAWVKAKETAKAAMTEYFPMASAPPGNAAITALLDLSPVPTGPMYQLQGNLLWSPVYGLVINCTSTSCPLQLTLTVSQCGPVSLTGGDPAEAKYTFDGDPTTCPAVVTVTYNTPAGGGGGSVNVPLVLHLEAGGAGNDGILSNPGSLVPQVCTGPAMGGSCV